MFMEITLGASVANAVLSGIRFRNACAVGASEAAMVQMLGKNLEVLLKVRSTRNAKRPWSDGYFGRALEKLCAGNFRNSGAREVSALRNHAESGFWLFSW